MEHRFHRGTELGKNSPEIRVGGQVSQIRRLTEELGKTLAKYLWGRVGFQADETDLYKDISKKNQHGANGFLVDEMVGGGDL